MSRLAAWWPDGVWSPLLWGPPGCGRTTIARLLAERTGLALSHCRQLSQMWLKESPEGRGERGGLRAWAIRSGGSECWQHGNWPDAEGATRLAATGQLITVGSLRRLPGGAGRPVPPCL
ncbi:AAA family ATPase [Streptomyces sp. NBC_01264]|uniref:AAA family ATPase n=1 Tax=Streptomyces sp. NBC_01264 TaxID=2903804 RepID=UPI0022515724|nr:AAA family ATPase [Streptomyces sp. NBC_01264]MCX4782558.1 AAA family ATPase [Streptomyces sp. NBC_01264]